MADNIFTGGTSAWDTASNWSLGTVPTASDGHVAVFDSSSPNCSLGASNKVCNALMMTAYTNTLTFGVRTLAVAGDITLGTGHTFSMTTGGLVMNGTGNLTTNGFPIPSGFRFEGASKTFTMQDDLTVNGAFSFNSTGAAGSMAVNNNGTEKVIYAKGSIGASATGVVGTAKLVIAGTGSISVTGTIRLDTDINTTGTTTFGTTVRFATKTFRYISGTVDTTTNNSTLFIGFVGETTAVYSISGISLNNVTSQASNTITLGQDMFVGGAFVNSGGLTLNGSDIHLMGNATFGGSQIMAGTSNVYFDGAAPTWIGGTGTLRNNAYIVPSGTFTLTGTCNYNTGTLTYISGTTITTGGTLNIASSTSLQTSGMSWDTVNTTTGTITLNSIFNVTDRLTVSTASSTSFVGPYGFNVGELRCTTVNRSIILLTGNTYTVNNTLTLDGNGPFTVSTNRVNIFSSNASSDAYLNLVSTGTCQVAFVAATDIDSSGGRQITNVKGSILRTTNWYVTNPDKYFEFMNS